MNYNVGKINALAELERIGWVYQPVGENEIKCKCPAHDDATPSAQLNTEKNVWKCHACNSKGDIITFLCYALDTKREAMIIELCERYPSLKGIKEINLQTVEKFHERVSEAGPLLKELKNRGVTDEMIREARLGFHQSRITIPVFDEAGRCLNIRRYLPGAPNDQKMVNTKGYGELALYQREQIKKYDTLWLCGGEIKALVGKHYLNKIGIGAFSVTGGEGSWNSEWNPLLKGKTLYICMDIDAPGKEATKRLYKALALVADTWIIQLPLDKKEIPKGDLNDYIAAGANEDDLKKLMEEATRLDTPVGQLPKSLEVKHIAFNEVVDPSNVRMRLEFPAIISHIDPNPYLIPKEVRVSCNRNYSKCHLCSVNALGDSDALVSEGVDFTISSVSRELLSLIGIGDDKKPVAIANALGIPLGCKKHLIQEKEYYNVYEVCLTQQLDLNSEAADREAQPAVLVDSEVILGGTYKVSGLLYSKPQNQKATVVIDKIEETQDSLTQLSLTKEDLESLRIFQPKEWTEEGIRRKLEDIYSDFEYNVTRIFRRKALHLLIDLTYHSVLLFNFDDRLIPGWVSSLIIGDSAQGKSEASIRMMEHYGIGERVDCKGSTVAGIIGGLQQMGSKQWFVHWGIIPMHDRRLVILEEVKGAPPEVITKLTDSRSSGVVEIPKVERRKAYARTRLILISNPVSDNTISSYSYGVEAISELIHSPEDIRRLDIALVVSSREIDESIIAVPHSERDKIDHKYTSKKCHDGVVFAWTRKPEEITFSKKAIGAIFQGVKRLCSKFAESKIPLVNKGTMHQKLARLSAALAVRTYSVKNELVLVRECHVEYIIWFLESIYDSDISGYKEFSDSLKDVEHIENPEMVNRILNGTKHPTTLRKALQQAESFTFEDFSNWCDVDADTARGIIALLVRENCIRRDGREYRKRSDFIRFLKKMHTGKSAAIDRGDEF